jgi:CubicO group peptidase (beta-lactamase class C family)
MQPTSGFGQLFQYSNLMASAAGFIGGALANPKMELGAAYDKAMQEKVFAPLGMNHTTFDFAKAQHGNYAKPHADNIDGVPTLARMDLNYAVIAARPAGGVWTSPHDLARYVEMELAKGKLANGKQLVSAENLLARRVPQVPVGEDVAYGMGLIIDTQWGIPIIHHGGDLAGYHSDMMWFPDQGVGAVILTNADPGAQIRGPLLRRIAEVLFDGKPEAEARLAAAAKQTKAAQAKERERLVIPADAGPAAKLASHYKSAALGDLTVSHRGKDLVFDFGEWKSVIASRKNDDGTISFITIDPTLIGFEFVVSEREGKRALVIRDAQHEYAFIEG